MLWVLLFPYVFFPLVPLILGVHNALLLRFQLVPCAVHRRFPCAKPDLRKVQDIGIGELHSLVGQFRRFFIL
jgi:hypothetical protein